MGNPVEAVQIRFPSPGMGGVKEYKLPVPVSVNDHYVRTASGKVVLSPAAIEWRRSAPGHLREQGWRGLPSGPYALGLKLYLPTSKAYDVDNAIKEVGDCLAKLAGRNDKDCHFVAAERLPTKDDPRVMVCVWPYIGGS